MPKSVDDILKEGLKKIEKHKKRNSGKVIQFLWKKIEQKVRYIFLQGSTRSGKTYGVCIFIVSLCFLFKNTGMKIVFIRKGLTVLKTSLLLDFEEVLKKVGVNPDLICNKGLRRYNVFGNYVHYDTASSVSGQVADKLKGKKADIVVLDEGNELSYSEFREINIRNSKFMIITYNPTFTKLHWLRRRLLDRKPPEDCLITTYKDNKYLQKKQIRAIEELKEVDPEAWTVYGLGQFGVSMRNVFRVTMKLTPDEFKEEIEAYRKKRYYIDTQWGLDYGYKDPTCLIKCIFVPKDRQLFVINTMYSRLVTSSDEIQHELSKYYDDGIIFADTNREDYTNEIIKGGYPARNAIKGAGTRKRGVGLVRNWNINIVESHCYEDFLNEIEGYQYEVDSNGDVTDAIPDGNDHAMDAMRYAVMGHHLFHGLSIEEAS